MKKNLELYYIEDTYISFLKKAGNKSVENNYANKENQKPYVGIVVKVKEYSYFAPLSSPKPKYEKMSESNPTLFKIKKEHQDLIGVVRLNNMIPVPDKSLSKVDFEKIPDHKYKNLIEEQHRIMTFNADKIHNKARTIYDLVVNKKNDFYCKLSNDFNKLEKDCDRYQQKQISTDTDKKYSVTFEYEKAYSEAQGEKFYGVYVNNEPASVAIKNDPNIAKVLDKIAERKEFQEKNITADSLKSGLIKPTKLENEIKVTRPDNLTVDHTGKKIEAVVGKEKSSAMEL